MAECMIPRRGLPVWDNRPLMMRALKSNVQSNTEEKSNENNETDNKTT